MKRFAHVLALLTLVLLATKALFASAGTEGAAFLDIPVGARPAAMGGAYTALADDAYAATWNPAGLGRINSTCFPAQHLDYLDTMHYEYLSLALPAGLGASIQYLGSGDIQGRDEFNAATGDFSAYYAAYNLSYGREILPQLSLGLTG